MKRLAHREFFANLRYDPLEGINTPLIFTEAEIENEPIKWLKRLLLVRLGLSSLETLTSEINRFATVNILEAKNLCAKVATEATRSKLDFMIVLKIVSKDAVGLIPNYRI